MEESYLVFTFTYRIPLNIDSPKEIVQDLAANVAKAAKLLCDIDITAEDEVTETKRFLKICASRNLTDLFERIGFDHSYFQLATPE